MLDTVLHVDQEVLNLVGGIIVPLLTALLTKLTAPQWVKAVCTALLTAAAAFVALGLGPDGVRVGTYLATSLEIYAAAILSYYGLTKYIAARPLAQATATIGVTATEKQAA